MYNLNLKQLRLPRLVLAAGLASVAGAASATTSALGVASDYNVFVFGDSNQVSDTQGRIAVGGNATFTNMPVGETTSGAAPVLVVGGNLSYSNATIRQGGSIDVGGNASFGNMSINGDVSAGGSVTLAPSGQMNGNVVYGSSFTKAQSFSLNGTATKGSTTLPVDFAAAETYLTHLSAAQYSATDANAGLTYGALTVNASGAAAGSTSFFNVSADSFNHAYSGFNIIAPTNATVVLNVAGNSLSMPNTGFSLSGGISLDHVLFNFYQATSLTVQGSAHGSFLAPLADVTGGWGGFNGTLVAASLSGIYGPASGLEFHTRDYGGGANTLFAGDGLRSAVSPVPEPAESTLMLVALAGIGAVLRKRKPGVAALAA